MEGNFEILKDLFANKGAFKTAVTRYVRGSIEGNDVEYREAIDRLILVKPYLSLYPKIHGGFSLGIDSLLSNIRKYPIEMDFFPGGSITFLLYGKNNVIATATFVGVDQSPVHFTLESDKGCVKINTISGTWSVYGVDVLLHDNRQLVVKLEWFSNGDILGKTWHNFTEEDLIVRSKTILHSNCLERAMSEIGKVWPFKNFPLPSVKCQHRFLYLQDSKSLCSVKVSTLT